MKKKEASKAEKGHLEEIAEAAAAKATAEAGKGQEMAGESAGDEGVKPDSSDAGSELAKLRKELNEKNEVLLRTVAEYQNFRKRTDKEKSDIYKFANEKIILDLLPVMDSFDRALAISADDESSPFMEGINLIKKSLDELFAKNYISEIDAIGKEFDHNMHHAVMTEEAEGVESNTVIDVLQKGYSVNGKVIRPAMVKVTPH
jgi:molecular chaperone GrpE